MPEYNAKCMLCKNYMHYWLDRLNYRKVKYFCLNVNWNIQPVHDFKSAARLYPSEQKHLAPDFEFIQMCWQDRLEQGSVNVNKDKLMKNTDINRKIVLACQPRTHVFICSHLVQGHNYW